MNQLSGVRRVVQRRMSCFVAVLTLITLSAVASAQQFVIGAYHLQKSARVSLTQYDYTYTADVTNSGDAAANIVGTVTSSSVSTIVMKGTVTFGAVPASGTITSTGTFTIRQDRTAAFDPGSLSWSFTTAPKPTANAGPGQRVAYTGQVLTLNGAGSTDPTGRPLTYQWTLVSAPPFGDLPIYNPTSAMAEFAAYPVGDYVIGLVVNDGISDSDMATTTLSYFHIAPVANAGPNQLGAVGSVIQLDASRSVDGDSNPITYSWSIVSAPARSAASLSSATDVKPTITLDMPGTYVAQLIVTDQYLSSTASTVTISTSHVPPVANTGLNQVVTTGCTATLDGTLSSDTNGAPLTYSWALLSLPDGSSATITGPTTVHPQFTVDVDGTYVAQLIVNDGVSDSVPATVVVSTNPLPPVANAGPNQVVQQTDLEGGGTYLDGTGSSDPNGRPLTYYWAILYQPPTQGTAAATLTNAYIAKPFLSFSKPGTYVMQLGVGNSSFISYSTMTVDVRASFIFETYQQIGNNSSGGGIVNTAGASSVNTTLTITSSDPVHFLLTLNPNVVGTASVSVPVAAGSIALFPLTIQGQNYSGSSLITGTVTAVAPGYISGGSAQVTLYPTGFYLGVDPGFPPPPSSGTPINTTTASAPTFVGPNLALLDPTTLGLIGYAGLGPQAAPVTLTINNSNPTVGSVSSNPITFGSGPARLAYFQPLSPGITHLTITEPPGYFTPSNRFVDLPVTVTLPPISVDYGDIVNNTSMVGYVSLVVPPPADEMVTVTSTNPTQFLLSADPNVLGTASIQLPLPAGRLSGPKFYIQGQNYSDSSYVGGLAVSAPNYASALQTVYLHPSGLFFVGGASLATTADSPPVSLDIEIGVLNYPPFGNLIPEYVALGPQAGSVPLTVVSSNPNVGTITSSPSLFPLGSSTTTVTFQPLSAGTTTLTLIEPLGFSTPSDQPVQVIVTVSP